MFFYLPFFTFIAAILLSFPDLIPWLIGLYVATLLGPRLWRRYR